MYINEALMLALQHDCCIRRKCRRSLKIKPTFKRNINGITDEGHLQIQLGEKPVADEKAPHNWAPHVEDIIASDWTITD